MNHRETKAVLAALKGWPPSDYALSGQERARLIHRLEHTPDPSAEAAAIIDSEFPDEDPRHAVAGRLRAFANVEPGPLTPSEIANRNAPPAS